MDKPRLLDLFCGAGGAAMGYHRAGFDVTGVDCMPQPRYPFRFVQADAMLILEALANAGPQATNYSAIHVSPPCQAYSVMRGMWNARPDHPDLLPPVHDLLHKSGLPYVIENVPGAPMAALLLMCGSSFGLGIPGFQLRRHRWFEPSPGWFGLSLPCQHDGPVIGIYGDHGRDRRRVGNIGRYFTMAERQQAMGIDWMKRDELDQAIPPAYTEYIGQQMLTAVLPGRCSGGSGGLSTGCT